MIRYRNVVIITILIVFALGFFTFKIKDSFSQQLQKNITSTMTTIKNAISADETWINTINAYTTFDSSDFQKVRYYVFTTGGVTCTIRPLIWNASASKWAVDHGEVQTNVSGGYSRLWETRHARYTTFLVNNIVGTGTVTVYFEGSNL